MKYITKFYSFDDSKAESLQKQADGETPDTLEIRSKYTSDNKDSHGDIITKEATINALEDYKNWRNIRYMHQPKPVGVATHIGENDGVEDLAWNETIVKLVDEDTIKQVQEEVLKGLSVGILFNPFDPDAVEIMDDGGWKIKEYMLAEISVVDHPANPEASIIENALKEIGEEVSFDLGSKEAQIAIRGANSSEQLVKVMKSLSNGLDKGDIDMTKELEQVEDEELEEELEEEATPEEEEISEEEDSPSDEEVEEETPEEEVEETDDTPEEEEEEVEETPEQEDEEVPSEPEEEVEEEESTPDEEEEESQPETSEDEEVPSTPESDEEVPSTPEEEEVPEDETPEQPSENHESEEKTITEYEGKDINDVMSLLKEVNTKLDRLLSEDEEVSEAESSEEDEVTPSSEETEESEEKGVPSNRQSNVEIDDEEEENKANDPWSRRGKKKGVHRIREALSNS